MKCFFRVIIPLLAAIFLFSPSVYAYECNNFCLTFIDFYQNLPSCRGAELGEESDICLEQREVTLEVIDITCDTDLSNIDYVEIYGLGDLTMEEKITVFIQTQLTGIELSCDFRRFWDQPIEMTPKAAQKIKRGQQEISNIDI